MNHSHELWDNQIYIHVTGVPEKKEKEERKYLEKLLMWVKTINSQNQGTQ
jgi:hypothetical protein